MADTYQEVIFWIIAVVMIVAAFRVVTTRNVIHAALYLVGTLLGAAGLYILLLAEFLAWAQVLVYVGAIVVLMLFGLMLTRAPIGSRDYDNNQRLPAAIVAGLLFGVVSWIMIDAFDGQKVDLVRSDLADRGIPTESVGEVIFQNYVLPFEAVSILLLAALIGAVLMARKDEGPPPTEAEKEAV
jgi:NADH-quinone oxidoreductase subunit J